MDNSRKDDMVAPRCQSARKDDLVNEFMVNDRNMIGQRKLEILRRSGESRVLIRRIWQSAFLFVAVPGGR